MPLRALARVNLAAIERNARRLRQRLAPAARLCAVVKADGYGHGATQVSRAALDAGAASLAVASAQEALSLREAGLPGPILVMGAVSDEELPLALQAGADVVAWSDEFVARLVRLHRGDRRLGVHVKLDSGMGRLGTREDRAALAVAGAVVDAEPALELAGAMTHFATADEDPEFVREQLRRFAAFLAALRERVPRVPAHAANSAAVLSAPASHLDMARCGIALYGCDPMHADPAQHGLEPALELTSYLAALKLTRPGESAGYGRRFVASRETVLATLPIGYGDGLRRALANNCEVLVGGRRYPLVGMVSMDNITIDLGPDPAPRCGDRAVIIGTDGSERQTAEDLARRIGTISYEVVCGISSRVPRVYHRDGQPA